MEDLLLDDSINWNKSTTTIEEDEFFDIENFIEAYKNSGSSFQDFFQQNEKVYQMESKQQKGRVSLSENFLSPEAIGHKHKLVQLKLFKF